MTADDEIIVQSIDDADSTAEAERLLNRFRERTQFDGATLYFADKVQWLDCRLLDGDPQEFTKNLEDRGYVRAPLGSFRAVVDARGVARVVSMRLRIGEYDWCDIRIGHGSATRVYRRIAYRGFIVFYDPNRKVNEYSS